MENFDEVIFDDEDEFLETSTEEPVQEEPAEPSKEEDLTFEVLRLKGIADPEKIKFEDESGAIIERNWDSLTKEEQLNILVDSGNIEETNDLSDDEIQFLNSVREKGMSIEQYLQSIQPVVEPSYKINELSDEDVYALDILEKVGADNITDEELTELIENAKKNENLFKKTVEGLRNEYIRLQQDEEVQKANQIAAEQQAAYEKFATSIYGEINNLNSFAGRELELSKEDMDMLASFMLDLDESGTSAFGRALQDPTLFTKAAFWLLNEEQIIEELTKQMQETYKRGYDAGKLDTSKLSKLVTKKVENPQKREDEFFFDEEEW